MSASQICYNECVAILISLIFGLFLGGIISKFLFVGSALSLIPWGLAGLFLGYLSKDRKAAILNGALYGFSLSYTFMIAGYTGHQPLVTRLVPFMIFGLFGAVCGLLLSLIGREGKGIWQKTRK